MQLAAQTAKKCFENAEAALASGDKKTALHWYNEASFKGGMKTQEEALDLFYDLLPKYVSESFETVSMYLKGTGLDQVLRTKMDDILTVYRMQEDIVKKNAKAKERFAIPLDTYGAAVRHIMMRYLTETESFINGEAWAKNRFHDATKAADFYRNYPLFTPQQYTAALWTPEFKTYVDQLAIKLAKKQCDNLHIGIRDALGYYASNDFREAYSLLKNALQSAEVDEKNCDGVIQARELMQKVLDKGQTKVIIMPATHTDMQDFHVTLRQNLDQYQDAFLKIFSQQEYENALYQHELSVEQLRSLDPVVLGKLNKALGIHFMIVAKVLRVSQGAPAYTKIPEKAYKVYYEESVTDNGTKVRKWYTQGTATYYKVAASKKWDVAVEVKVYDVQKKSIMYNGIKNFSFSSDIDYYEGLSDPEAYADKSLSYAQRRAYLTMLDTGADNWRANFNKSKEFADHSTVVEKAKWNIVEQFSPEIYKVLGSPLPH